MRLVSLFMFEPCSGWQLCDIHEYESRYSCTEAFTDDLLKNEDMQLLEKNVDCIGSSMVVHLELKSNYSVRHPDANQAHYKVEAVLTN